MFGLVLSKTIKLDVNLSEVHVQIIDDEPCRVNIISSHVFARYWMPFIFGWMFQYESGEIAVQDGESLIHTDGTGLISVDLARECPTSIFKGNFLKACDL